MIDLDELERVTRRDSKSGSHRRPHATVPVMVWTDIDARIAEDVVWLNSLPGVRTFASCQGTIGEGGPHPYPPQIAGWWPTEHDRAIRRRFRVGEKGDGWAVLYPRQERRQKRAKR